MTARTWVVFPSADPQRGLACASAWMAKGFCVLVMLNADCVLSIPGLIDASDDPTLFSHGLNLCSYQDPAPPFAGYYRVINGMCRIAFDRFGARAVLACGDDMEPPKQSAEEIEAVYFDRFPDGFGIMQGTGDPQGDKQFVPGHPELGQLHAAARICGSPLFGRAWFERANQGRGPFWSEYRSYYADEELWNVALRENVLWLNPDVMIFHRHWSFGWHKPYDYQRDKHNNHWKADAELFVARYKAGFPGSTPLPIPVSEKV